MTAAQRDLFRELLAAASSREDAEAAFYSGLCRLEAMSLEAFARLDEALRRLEAPAGLRAAVAQASRERVTHARLAGMLARRLGLETSARPPECCAPAARRHEADADDTACGDEYAGGCGESGREDSGPTLAPQLGGGAPASPLRSEGSAADERRGLLGLARCCEAEALTRQGYSELLRSSASGRGPLLSAALRSLALDEAAAARVLQAVALWAQAHGRPRAGAASGSAGGSDECPHAHRAPPTLLC